MRTFVTLRFWLALAALAGLTFGLVQLTRDGGAAAEPSAAQTDGAADGDGDGAAGVVALPERQIDLIAPVFLVQADPGTSILNGVATGRMQIRVDGFRYMNIQPGTPGEHRCERTTELASCVVVADLLGEAVLWFSLLPAEPRNEVTLPQILELREGSLALLANGWLVRHADVIERDCDDDIPSMGDFLRTYAEGSTTTFSLDLQQIISVTCADAAPIDTAPRATVAPSSR